MRLLLIVLVVLAATAVAPSASAAGCGSVQAGGRGYVFYKQGVTCAFGRKAVRRLVRSGGRNAPKGFRCSSGSGFKAGGSCVRKGNKAVYFGWHPGD